MLYMLIRLFFCKIIANFAVAKPRKGTLLI